MTVQEWAPFGYTVAIILLVMGFFIGVSGVAKDFSEAVGRLAAGACMIVAAAIIFVIVSGIWRL